MGSKVREHLYIKERWKNPKMSKKCLVARVRSEVKTVISIGYSTAGMVLGAGGNILDIKQVIGLPVRAQG